MMHIILIGYLISQLLGWEISTKDHKSTSPARWHGFDMIEFKFDSVEAKIVFPGAANQNRNWIWRARFWGHEPQLDIALLEKGYHLVYVDVSNLYGNQQAVKRFDQFYAFLQKNFQLHTRAVLEGMSRGGLIVYNWAAENPDKVSCIYADAPVCDIKSWPGGYGAGKGSPADWKSCLKAYGLDENSVKNYQGLPVYNCTKVAQAGIPAIHVCGTDDKVVPLEENTGKLAHNYRKAGGYIEVLLKEGVGHHPHSLEDPTQLVEFITKYAID